MKALLLFGLLVIASGAFISATKKTYHPELNRDAAFTQSIDAISSLKTLNYTGDKIQFDNEFRKLANAHAVLQDKYPDLTNPATATSMIDYAMDNMKKDSRVTVHGDSCLKPLVKAVFACFRSCLNHTALRACLATACADYQVCKEGGPRR